MSHHVALYFSMMQYQPDNLAFLRSRFDVIERASPDDAEDAVLERVELCFAPLGYRFDAERMERMPRLMAIASNTTGVPHIDMEAAAERGISVFSLKDEQAFLDSITPTAEHTWGLLLAVTRRISWAHAAIMEGRWNRRPWGGRSMLSRQTLGVVGYGRLGRRVARYGHAFGMHVYFYDPNVDDGFGIAERLDSVQDLVSHADVVSLHAPANTETQGLLSADVFRHFRPGAVLINTARGELVDEDALLNALVDGTISAAALDVLNGEFVPGFECSEHPLVAYARSHDNLLLTPHIGGSTVDAWRETERRVLDLTAAFFEGMDG